MLSIEQLQAEIVCFLHAHALENAPSELYEPINYIMQLGGKRLRPVLCLLSSQMFGGNLDQVLPVAIGLEYFHNFTLVHDDIMDAADLRRGQSTVHHKYNTNTAILSGDLMLIKAYEYICQAPKQLLANVLQIFNQTAIEVCEGQQYDMNYETQETVSVNNYMKMIELKTAVLIAASLKIGALIGGATEKDAQHLYEFGRHIGIAFQLQDDLLDTYGDSKKFGKKIGGDIINNKKTYLLLKALEIADEATSTRLKSWLINTNGKGTEKVEAVTAIYNQLNIEQTTQNLLNHYYKIAFKHLEQLSLTYEKQQPLQKIVQTLLTRQV